jgi:hypothetical protein
MPDELQSEMATAAESAVQHAKKHWATDLDFSPRSVEDVELILARMYDSVPRGFLGKLFKQKPSEEQMAQVAIAYGAYLGEVFRREFGGIWSKENVLDQKDALALKFSDRNMIFPPGKVWKRLRNGEEDNVNVFYKVIRQRLEQH